MFQCLLIEGENVGPEARRNAESFVITDTQFDRFLERHNCVQQLVPESNTAMRDSYLILDEYVCCIDVVFCQLWTPHHSDTFNGHVCVHALTQSGQSI